MTPKRARAIASTIRVVTVLGFTLIIDGMAHFHPWQFALTALLFLLFGAVCATTYGWQRDIAQPDQPPLTPAAQAVLDEAVALTEVYDDDARRGTADVMGLLVAVDEYRTAQRRDIA
jgi:hypothetical protein